MPNSLAPQTASYGEHLRRLAAQLSVIQMQAAQVLRNATWTDAHGNTWEAIQGANGKFVKIVLVSHGPGQEHIGPIGTERGVHEATGIPRYSADFGKSASGKGESAGKAVAATEHPFAAEYRARLAALNDEAEHNGYHEANPAARKALAGAMKAARGGKGGKASGKTEGGRKMKSASDVIKSLNEGPQPIRDHINDSERAWPFDPASPPDPLFKLALYGEAQLHDALAFYPTSSLRDSFKRLQQYGYAIAKPPVGASREELIQRLSDFAKNPQKGEPPSSTAKTAKADEHRLVSEIAGQLKPISSNLRFDSFGGLDERTLNDAHRVYGSSQLKDAIFVLADPAKLRAKAEEMGIAGAKTMSRAELASRVADAWLQGKARIDGPPSHLDAALREGTAKTAGAGKKGSGTGQRLDELHPVRGLPKGLNIGTFRVPNPYILTYYYGSKQVRTALEAFPIKDLKESAKLVQERNPGTSPKSTSKRDDLLDYILSHVSEDQAVAVVNELASNSGQRAIQPDLTPFARTLAAIHADLRRIA